MAHFAELNEDNYVIRVIVVNNQVILDENGNESEEIGIKFCQSLFGENTNWKQTSYNGNIRRRFAAIGHHYDSNYDAFILPQPYPSWVLNQENLNWYAPVQHPRESDPTNENIYSWNELEQQWDLVE